MSARPGSNMTLADVFGLGRGNARQPPLQEQESGRIASFLKSRPAIALADVEREVGHATETALSTCVVDILLNAWCKLAEVGQVAATGSSAPEMRHLVPLLRHSVSSQHTPKIEIICDGAVLVTLPLEVKLTLTIEAAKLAIQAGHVVAVALGGVVATGSVACRGVTLASVSAKDLRFPGEIVLSPAVPIVMGQGAPASVLGSVVRGAAGGFVLSGVAETGQAFSFTLSVADGASAGHWTIGRRAERCEIVVSHGSISGVHARLRLSAAGELAICDLGSSNGTFVDGLRIGQEFVAIGPASRVRLGPVELMLRSGV